MNGLCRRRILHLMYFGRWVWIAKVFEHIKPTLIFGQGILITTYSIWWKDSIINSLLRLRGLVEILFCERVCDITLVSIVTQRFLLATRPRLFNHSPCFIQPQPRSGPRPLPARPTSSPPCRWRSSRGRHEPSTAVSGLPCPLILVAVCSGGR